MGETNKEVEAQSTQIGGSEKEQLYGEVIQKEARSLLTKYLPEALPQEPTEIFLSVFPQYIGKFKGKHYIVAEGVIYSHAQQKQSDEMMRRQEDSWEAFVKEEDQRTRLIGEKTKTIKGGFDDTDWEQFFKELDEQFASSKKEPELEPKPEPEDWEEPEGLLKGRGQYSVDTWWVIYSLVHELIHQRQAELNPQAFPQLQSSDLDNINLDNTSRRELKTLLIEAHKSHSRSMNNNSLFYPIAEGMAVMGSFYVMGKLLADLKESGLLDEAKKAILQDFLGNAFNNYGYTLVQLERPGEAIPRLQEALRFNPTQIYANNNLGDCHRSLGNLASAKSHYERELELNPTHPHAQQSLDALDNC